MKPIIGYMLKPADLNYWEQTATGQLLIYRKRFQAQTALESHRNNTQFKGTKIVKVNLIP